MPCMQSGWEDHQIFQQNVKSLTNKDSTQNSQLPSQYKSRMVISRSANHWRDRPCSRVTS